MIQMNSLKKSITKGGHNHQNIFPSKSISLIPTWTQFKYNANTYTPQFISFRSFSLQNTRIPHSITKFVTSHSVFSSFSYSTPLTSCPATSKHFSFTFIRKASSEPTPVEKRPPTVSRSELTALIQGGDPTVCIIIFSIS